MRNSRMNSITQICRQKCIFNKVTSRKNGEVKIQEKLKDQGKPQNLLLSFQEALPSAQVMLRKKNLTNTIIVQIM